MLMSKEERIDVIINEIKDIYIHLTEEEPTPDEEIKARDNLIKQFKDLRLLEAFNEYNQLINTIIEQLKEWDTLELWFEELKDLPDNIKRFLEITGLLETAKKEEKEESELSEEEETLKEESEQEKKLKRAVSDEMEKNVPGVDIEQIVAQVSEQFKGQINNLKDRIEHLQEELKSKEATTGDTEKQKSVRKIKPKRESKLPPPEIKIPAIKKPQKPPKVKVSSSHKAKETIEKEKKEKQKTQLEIETELNEEIIEENVEEKKDETPAQEEEEPSLEEKPIIPPTPTPDIDKESPEKDESFSTPPKKPKKDLGKPKVPSPPSSQKKDNEISKPPSPPEKKETIPEKPMAKEKSPSNNETKSKKPRITPVAIEEPIESERREKGAKPFVSEKPKVAEVEIKEEEPKREGNKELLSVFTPFGRKEKTAKPEEEKTKTKEVKEVQVRNDQQKILEESELGINQSESKDMVETSEDDLPTDKESLYQELIALEGKRYSLEKNFKDLEERYKNGSLSDAEYKQENDELKERLDSITSRITKIRRIVSSL